MDELDLLKKDWKKQDAHLPHIKAKEIYPLLLKKSSSIVKWIFLISIAELILGVLLNFFTADQRFWEIIEDIHLKTANIIMYIIDYIVLGFFIFMFYKRYRAINTTDSASALMKNILKTRKIVKYYIIYVLTSSGITFFIAFIFTLLYSNKFEGLRTSINWNKAIAIGLIVTIIFIGILWGIYTLLYGILLRKLKKNYKEIKRLEI
ncbi:hypothetical protein [Mesonia aestuariivivens]|uniref:Beta-carotene 15,15'-monooxygenase n=1 Tax=Mesonia aestuariivivens TaxID=2796128 RepID=A0ABS6VY80_9FLAO|nr:hypothetical protein [Mesonia aestuariivivens]MBW2960531.1 hypothetical protein [Mesonia aestuariivivens]